MFKIIHKASAVVSLFLISMFLTASLVSELFMTTEIVRSVKALILNPGIFILVPSIALTGISGRLIAKARVGKIIDQKKKRMSLVAANGILILVPAALFLSAKADKGEFDTLFYTVQIIEIVSGSANLTLIIKNILSGIKIRR